MCPAAGRRPIGQPDRDLLVRLVDAPVALLLRAQRRHDLRGRLPAGGLFLSAVRAGRRGHRRPWSWARWPRAGPWAPRRSGSSSFPRCSPWSIAGLLAPAATAAGSRWLRIAIVVLLPMVTGGYWFIRNAVLTGNPLYPLEVRVLGRTVWAGWYGPEAMRTSPLLPAPERLEGAGRYPAGRPRPQARSALARGHRRRLGGGELPDAAGPSAGSRSSRSMAVLNVALYWVVHSLPDAAAIHAPGPGAGRRPAGRHSRSQPMAPPSAATSCSALHIFTPQNWPFAAREADDPVGPDPRRSPMPSARS